MKKPVTSIHTKFRTGLLAMALLNQTFFMLDFYPFPKNRASASISILFTIFAAGLTWWKNNSFTSSALEVDCVRESLNPPI